ncbi:MAG: PKD domain-containing protein [Nocardioidaceae bacterium]
MRRFLISLLSFTTALVVVPGLLATATATPAATAAGTADGPTPQISWTARSGLPSPVPAAYTPWARDGSVQAYARVGQIMVAGGNFSSVAAAGGSPTYSRTAVFAFDAATGAIVTTFNPVLNGNVNHLLAGPIAGTVYVGGSFTTVNGTNQSHLVLLDVTTGAVVTSFRAAATNGVVQTLARLGNRLFVGGNFRTVGGVAHSGLATMNATTGALDPYMGVQLDGHHNTVPGGARGAIGGNEMDINAQGDRLVVIGNFKTANGMLRDQLVMITLGATSASVTSNWATNRYSPTCIARAYDSDVRGVAFSPDGTFFVVTATGGSQPGALCDAAARWETYATGTSLDPTWVDLTGRDTVWGVAVTDDVVYVGGHNRWMNNPNGTDNARAGAVPRPGLSALDPVSGEPLDWNPGRNPRGVSAKVFLPTNQGIWMGMDTDWVGNHRYHHPRLVFFPYTGGRPVAPTTVSTLPGRVLLGGSGGANAVPMVSLSGSGSIATAAGSLSTPGFDWTKVRGATLVGATLFYGYTDGFLYKRTFNGTAFGPAVKIDPYHDPVWSNVQTGSGQTYVGVSPPLYDSFRSGSVSGMAYSNGRLYYTLNGNAQLHSVLFTPDSGIVNPIATNYSGGFSWSHARGMFFSGSTLYVGSSTDGSLNAVPMSAGGAPLGSSSKVNSAFNWATPGLFLFSPQNQPPVAQFVPTCTATTCSFDASSSTDDGGIVSYTWYFGDGTRGTGRTTSHNYGAAGAFFTVTMTVADAQGLTNTTSWTLRLAGTANQPPSAVIGSSCSGLACAFNGSGSHDPDGIVRRFKWAFGDGATSTAANPPHTYVRAGTYPVTLTVTDDKGATGTATKTVTVAPPSGGPAGNQAPVAAFSPSCTGMTCGLDATASHDPDGSITAYAWSFGDNSTGAGATPSHTYSTPNAYTVSLTVTDDKGGTSTVSHSVTAVQPGQGAVRFVGADSVAGNTTAPGVRIPAGVAAGDRLLLVLSTNSPARSATPPAGWSRLGSNTARTLGTTMWTRMAATGEAGALVKVRLGGRSKVTLSVAAYRGTSATPSFATAQDAASSAAHTTPTVAAGSGAWVVSYWADKSSTTTSWTLPAGLVRRAQSVGVKTGRVASLLADSGGPVSAGTRGGLTATADAAARMATMWSVVLPAD